LVVVAIAHLLPDFRDLRGYGGRKATFSHRCLAGLEKCRILMAMLAHRQRAGRSADEIFQKGRREWRKSILVRLAAVLIACSPVAIVAWLFAPHGEFFAGMVVGGLLAIAIWVWDEPPPFVENWRLGRDGERATAKELRKLKPEGWTAQHDLADKYGNLDHVVIGPGGVFLLDSKHRWGTFAIENGVLTYRYPTTPGSRQSMATVPGRLKATARDLERRLQKDLGWIVDVRPVVVLWADFRAGEAVLDGVPVVRGDRLSEWLRGQPSRVSAEDQKVVRAVVVAQPAAL
jgi:hypothetical protein